MTLPKLLFALAIGTAGGWLAHWAALPLAWMIGAMLATTGAAIAGAPMELPQPLRNVFVAVLGVMLGSGFTPALLPRLGEWTLSLSALLAYTAASAAIGYVFLRRLCGHNRSTAYFAAMPGGLSEMILVGSAMGGDGRVISLIHASRILLVVLSLPFAFQAVLGYDPASQPIAGLPAAELGWLDLGILGLCALLGTPLAKALRVPAAQIVGPMVLSAVVHLAGLTTAAPPVELVAAAQVVIGTAIGCRFGGTTLRFVGRVVLQAAGLTALLLAVTLASALVVHWATALPTPSLILAYAPGGLAEMSLVALALALDAAFVATHHIVRIFLVVVLAPISYRLFVKTGQARHGKGTKAGG